MYFIGCIWDVYDWNDWNELDDLAHFSLSYTLSRLVVCCVPSYDLWPAAHSLVSARCRIATLFLSLCRTAYGTTTTVARVHRAHVDIVTESLKKATECDTTEEPEQWSVLQQYVS